MYIKLLFLIVAASAVNAGPTSNRVDYGRTALGDSVERVSMKMLKGMYERGDDKNVILSPICVMLLLSLYAGGAGEQSRAEISDFLEEDYKRLSAVYGSLSKQLAEQDPSFLTLANKMYVSNNYTLVDQFKKLAVDTYDSEIETVNFLDVKAAADKINQWADKKTKGHISNPIGPNTLDPETAVALINIIFFQGHWREPFERYRTRERDFYVDRNTIVKKPTMQLQRPFFYTENSFLEFRMIKLPFKETGFSMLIVLPNEIDGLPELLDKLTTHSLANNIIDWTPSHQAINVELPKFEVKNSLNLNEFLSLSDVSKIFEEGAPGIVNERPLIVSKVFQDAFIKVDEQGTTAGAFTGIDLVPNSFELPAKLDFIVDHPFLYLIMFQEKMMFVGTYTH